MQTLLDIMRTLRAPDGCPWDQKQTHDSLRPYLLEEAAEAVDVLHTGDTDKMTEELGDVLLQIAFHAVIAEEEGTFGYNDIEKSIVDKLVRRHPHVFDSVEVKDADEVVTNWQAIKAGEKGASAADEVPHSLSALMRAAELGKKLRWLTVSKEDVVAAVDNPQGLEPHEHVGQLLLTIVDYARAQGVNPELALRDAASQRAETK